MTVIAKLTLYLQVAVRVRQKLCYDASGLNISTLDVLQTKSLDFVTCVRFYSDKVSVAHARRLSCLLTEAGRPTLRAKSTSSQVDLGWCLPPKGVSCTRTLLRGGVVGVLQRSFDARPPNLRPNCWNKVECSPCPPMSPKDRIFIELMTLDRKLNASREGSKWRT